MIPPRETFCTVSHLKGADCEGRKTVASPEDRQYKLEKDVRGTDFDIQTLETQSTRETVNIRYPWDEKGRGWCGKSEKGNVSILITKREFLIPPRFSQGTKNRKMAEVVGI